MAPTVEAIILGETREVLNNPKLYQKDIARWAARMFPANADQVVVWLKEHRVYVCVDKAKDLR